MLGNKHPRAMTPAHCRTRRTCCAATKTTRQRRCARRVNKRALTPHRSLEKPSMKMKISNELCMQQKSRARAHKTHIFVMSVRIARQMLSIHDEPIGEASKSVQIQGAARKRKLSGGPAKAISKSANGKRARATNKSKSRPVNTVDQYAKSKVSIALLDERRLTTKV
jgi:hypothetical protein